MIAHARNILHRTGSPASEPVYEPRPTAALIAVILLVCLITLLTFWPARTTRTLMFDDESYLTINHLVQKPSWNSTWRFLTEVLHPSTVGGYYQPLAMISLMLDYIRAGGPDDHQPFHTTSILIHVLNTALTIILIYQLFGSIPAAAICGLLFGVHPMHVESIAWIAERKSVLAATFALAAMITYTRYALRGRPLDYAATTGLFVLALLSKPTTTPLPAVFLLMDIWPFRRWSRRALVEKVPLFLLAGISAVITVLSQHNTAEITTPSQYPRDALPLVLCHNIVFYLWKLIVPLGLSGYYDIPRPWGTTHPAVLVGILGTLGLAATLIISLRWTRSLAIGWLIFFAAIFPTMGVIGFTSVIAADRFVYFPMIGLLFPLAAGLTTWWERNPTAASRPGLSLATVVVALLYAYQARLYLGQWENTEKFHRYMVKRAPEACSVHMGLGNELQRQERFGEALVELRRAVECDPTYATARVNYGYALEKDGRREDARKEYLTALDLQPNLAEAHNFLGNLLATEGKLDEAMRHYESSLRLKPESSRLRHNLATTLATIGKFPEAIEQFRIVVELDPMAPKSWFNFGLAYLRTNRLEEAAAALTRAVALKPDYVRARYQLGVALIRLGRIPDGIAQWQTALQQAPNWVGLAAELSWVLATCEDPAVRRPAESLHMAQEAARLTQPPDPNYLDVLAAAQARGGDFAAAVATAGQAVALCRQRGNEQLAGRIDARLNQYRAGRPYDCPAAELIRNIVSP